MLKFEIDALGLVFAFLGLIIALRRKMHDVEVFEN